MGLLVEQHLRMTQSVSAGVQALADSCTSFAYTQAAWRFFRHESVTLPVLYEPLIEAGRLGIESCKDYGLVIHDWSRLNYHKHDSKVDKIQMSHKTDSGYELQSSLLVSDVTGQPIAPLVQNLISTQGNHSSLSAEIAPVVASHLDELSSRLGQIQGLGFSKPLVHIVDREADSVLHLRQWQAEGHYWLTRSRENSHGEPLPLRVIVSRVIYEDKESKEATMMAEWYLLSNVPKTTEATTLAQWYCWRWQIESLFKLLKTAGFALEDWQQDKRLRSD